MVRSAHSWLLLLNDIAGSENGGTTYKTYFRFFQYQRLPFCQKIKIYLALADNDGSEPGVLNLTTALIDSDGHRFCVTATWNLADHPLAEPRLISL